MVEPAASARARMLVSQHWRRNPLVQQAIRLIRDGAIAKVRAAQVTCWFCKPDDDSDNALQCKQSGADMTENLAAAMFFDHGALRTIPEATAGSLPRVGS